MEPWEKSDIESQVAIFPEGQFVIEFEDRLIASCSSLIVDFDDYADIHDWDEIAAGGTIKNHNPDGDTLYGIEIMVDPDFRNMKLSRRLYEARKQLCRKLNLKRFIIGGRIPGYRKYRKKMSTREYVEKAALFRARRLTRGIRKKVGGIYPPVPGAIFGSLGQIQHQHHRRIAFYPGRRQNLQCLFSVSPERRHRQAGKTSHHFQ
jgi:GNAT superfamily N-acetyltransferase